MTTTREFRACATCGWLRVDSGGNAVCGMFGFAPTQEARRNAKLCGRHGDAWNAEMPAVADGPLAPTTESS